MKHRERKNRFWFSDEAIARAETLRHQKQIRKKREEKNEAIS